METEPTFQFYYWIFWEKGLAISSIGSYESPNLHSKAISLFYRKPTQLC